MNHLPLFRRKFFAILLLTILSRITHAQDWSQIAKITANVRTEDDLFGRSVAISGNYAVVGGLDNSSVNKAGAAYIFHNDAGTWTFVKKLTAATQVAGEEFGFSVAISGDYIVVGSYRDDEDEDEGNPLTDAGSVYIYGKDVGGDWVLIKKIVAEDRVAGQLFGNSVAISGNYVVVGASHFDFVGSEPPGTGAVYVFHKDSPTSNSWGFVKKITAESSQTGFGFGVAIDGLQFIVGALGENFTPAGPDPTTLTGAGAVYFYKNDGSTPHNWALQTKLTAIEPTGLAFFGMFVSINGNRAVVGSPFEDSWQGAAYLCTGDGANWTTAIKFTAPSLAFGSSVSIYGDKVLIGTVGDGTDADGENTVQQAGAVYLYKKDYPTENSWGMAQKIVASDRKYFGKFGSAVAISGNYFIVGANGNSTDAEGNNLLDDVGAAYIFTDPTALPVILAGFQATKVENHALLRWTTTAETNTDYFEVQRSTDGKRWTALGRIAAANESTTLQPYVYTDKTPTEGQNLYRLKMADQDGTFTYSRIQSVSFDKSLELAAFPNPVSNRLFFTQSTMDQISSVQITDLTGRIILTTDKISDQGLSLENLHAGFYIVRVKKKDDVVISRKVVVKR